MADKKKDNFFKNLLIAILSCIIILAVLEGCARLFLYFSRGSSTVGLVERTQHLSYQPFVMFGSDWDNEFAKYAVENNEAGAHSYRILLLGGSTAASFPKKILEEAFSRKFGGNFEVINGAYGGYNVRQELIVAALWGPNLKPDMVITLDGANDLIHRLRMKKAGTFYLDPTYELLLKKPMLGPLINLMMKSQLIQGTYRLGERISVGSADNYMDAIPVYLSAQHNINVIAKGVSAARIIVLQPFIAFKEPQSAAEAGFKHYQYRELVIKRLYNKLYRDLADLAKEDNVLLIDGRNVFNGLAQTIFSDDVHFQSDEGYRLLSEYIVGSIPKEMLRKKVLNRR